MNAFQQNLYTDLMNLVSTTETFYFTDATINETIYRTFSYRLVSYTEFLKPSALECRGHMFRINSNGEMEELVSMPFEKFFNLGEVSSEINTLAEALILQGRLSRDVYERAKRRNI